MGGHPGIGSLRQPAALILPHELSSPTTGNRDKRRHIGSREPVFRRTQVIESFVEIATRNGGGGSHEVTKRIAPRHALPFDLSGIALRRPQGLFS